MGQANAWLLARGGNARHNFTSVALNKRIGIAPHSEQKRPPEIDVPKSHRTRSAQPSFIDCLALFTPTIHDSLHP